MTSAPTAPFPVLTAPEADFDAVVADAGTTQVAAPPAGAFFLPLKRKSVVLAYLLCLAVGLLGLHQLYIGNRLRAITYVCTLGGFFGAMVLIDVVTLWHQVRRVNRLRDMGIV